MPTPSLPLQSTLARWSDLDHIARRDLEIAVESLSSKARRLEELRRLFSRHRAEDMTQLSSARQDAWSRWDERLKRLREWTAQGEHMAEASRRLSEWRASARWFERAQAMARRYAERLDPKAGALEKRQKQLAEKLQDWSARLSAKEWSLNDLCPPVADPSAEAGRPLTLSQKRAYLDGLYAERDYEGTLILEMRAFRSAVQRLSRPFARIEAWAGQIAEQDPTHFEIPRSHVWAESRFLRGRLTAMEESQLQLEAAFEENRQKLRSIYAKAQRLPAVEEPAPPPPPALRERVRRIGAFWQGFRR